MSTQLQIAFTKADEQKNKLKELKQSLKDEMDNSPTFKNIIEKEAALKAEKKKVIEAIIHSNPHTVENIEKITADLKNQKQLVSDVALKDYLAGEDVKVNKKGVIYRPEFSCKFVKTEATELTPIKDKLQL